MHVTTVIHLSEPYNKNKQIFWFLCNWILVSSSYEFIKVVEKRFIPKHFHKFKWQDHVLAILSRITLMILLFFTWENIKIY